MEYNIEDQIDKLFANRPDTLRKVKENREFIHKIKNYRIKSDSEKVKVFGGKSVNLNAILKNNIYNYTAFVIDNICNLHANMTYEQLKKYIRKKRAVPMNMIWILIIMFGVIVAILVIIFLLPQLGGMI